MTRVRVTDTTFVRDIGSKALLNTDAEGLRGYRERRKMKNELNTMKDQLADMAAQLATLARQAKAAR